MKQIFLLLAVFACLTGQAWIIEPTSKTKTYEVNFSNYIPDNRNVTYYNPDNPDDASPQTGTLWNLLSLKEDGFRIYSLGTSFMYGNDVKPQSNVNAYVKGPVSIKRSNNGTATFIIAGGSNGCAPIKRLTITYVNIEDGVCKPTVSDYRGDITETVRETTNAPNNGLKYYEYVAEPQIPISTFVLSADKFCSTVPTSEFKKSSLGTKELISGFVVTKIKIEYYDLWNDEPSANVEFINKVNDLIYSNTDLAVRNQIHNQDIKLLAQHYSNTSTADINEDGTVNAADVVTIYNHIINGQEASIADGHEYVDLGLPSNTLWATCNVGAPVPEAFGDYFAFRECEQGFLSGKHIFNRDTWKPVRSTNDLVYSEWGSNWKVPNEDDYNELINNCTFESTSINRINCMKFTSKHNGRQLILPYAGEVTDLGFRNNSGPWGAGYWTCSGTSTGFNSKALSITGAEEPIPTVDFQSYHRGLPVRLIHKGL